MKKIIIGLFFLASAPSYSNCNLFLQVNSGTPLERAVIKGLEAKGYKIVDEEFKANLSLDEVYSSWHGGDGVTGYASRIALKNLKSDRTNYFVGDYTNYFFGLGMKKNPALVSMKRAIDEIEDCK